MNDEVIIPEIVQSSSVELEPLRQQTALVERAERMLAQAAGDPLKLGDVIRQAEAARVLARQVKLGTAAINSATAVKLRAEVRLADAIDAAQAAGEVATHGRPVNVGDPNNSGPMPLAAVGVKAPALSEARMIRRIALTSDEAEAHIIHAAQQATEEDRDFTRTSVLQAVRTAEAAPAREALEGEIAEGRAWLASIPVPEGFDPAEERRIIDLRAAIYYHAEELTKRGDPVAASAAIRHAGDHTVNETIDVVIAARDWLSSLIMHLETP